MAEACERQAHACAALGSPLYARLLPVVAADVRAGGPSWDVLAGHADEPSRRALALRLMAAVHTLVLERQAPDLALHYPSVGGTATDGAEEALLTTIAAHVERLHLAVRAGCQTNEVGRSAALLPGFLAVARAHGLPLHLLEIGASAGLNLRWDRYRYPTPRGAWGPPDALLVLDGLLVEPGPLAPPEVEVVGRLGCDPRPVDPTTPAGRTALTASVWPDMTVRHARLRAALAEAAATPAHVAADSVATWLPDRLAERPDAATTVVFHSIVEQYLGDAEAGARDAALAVAGAAATPASPLVWLRLEPDGGQDDLACALDATTWPGGATRRIATAGPHGQDVRVSGR